MASVQGRHHKDCALSTDGKWTFRAVGKPVVVDGVEVKCSCPRGAGPIYYVHRREDGKAVYEQIGKNLELARRACRQIEDRLDEAKLLAKLGARPRERVDATFTDWSQRWFDGLSRAKPTTKYSYLSTLKYARAAFGDRLVRVLDTADIRAFLKVCADGLPVAEGEASSAKHRMSKSTLAKHLRVLNACLDAAITEGLATENPARALPKSMRPAPPAESVPAYFTDAELAKLWLAMPNEMPGAVFTYLCKLAMTTGMRQGELLALRWSDVKLLESEIELKRTYTHGKDAAGELFGETTPKSGKSRTIDLTAPARSVLEEWMRVSGVEPGADTLVFPNAAGGHLVFSTVLRGALYPAMVRAGVPREGEHGRKRDFHSFRHTFARISLQGGAKGKYAAEITWLQRQLGHSSITLTVDRYGRWDRKGEKRQAKALGGAFTGLV